MTRSALSAIVLIVLGAMSLQTQAQSVFAHYMFAYTYSQGTGDFVSQIQRAQQGGIDGFAVNIGPDAWIPGNLHMMYDAASQCGDFKIFVSLDMNYDYGGWDTLLNYVRDYYDHPNAFRYDNRFFISTFAGQQHGDDDWQNNFKNVLSNEGKDIFFVPSFFYDPNGIFDAHPVMDGWFDWNAWSMGNSYKDTGDDVAALNSANNNGKIYMAGVSPWFFTHFGGTWNKNWIYKSESLWPIRWQQIVDLRPQLVEIITWNDYGESSYIGPISGDLPVDDAGQGNSHNWCDGFDHQSWLDMAGYYIQAYKNGGYPSIDNDRVYYWYRTTTKYAQRGDSLSIPNNNDWAEDVVVVHTQLKADAQIQVSIGGNVQYFDVSAGANTITAPFGQGAVVVTLLRDGNTIASQQGDRAIDDNGGSYGYNFNAWVGQFSA